MRFRKLTSLFRAVKRQPAQFFLKRHLSKLKRNEKTFFVILMPASIHVALLAIKKIQNEVNIVLIGNGLSSVELKWIKQNLNEFPLVSSREKLHHHQVLNLLLKVWSNNFGILDYDCFVMDENIISRMTDLRDNQVISSPFCWRNEDLKITFPETFLLYFNVEKVKFLMGKYNIDSRIYFWHMLKPPVLEVLELLGIKKSSMPEPQKNYFDTLKLIFLLALYEDMSFKFVEEHTDSHGNPETVYHIGSIAKPNVISNSYSFRGSYFWRKSLENVNDPVLYQEAILRFGAATAADLQEKYPELYQSMDETYLEFVEKALQHQNGKKAA